LALCLAFVAAQDDRSGLKASVNLTEVSKFLTDHSGILFSLFSAKPILLPEFSYYFPNGTVPVIRLADMDLEGIAFRNVLLSSSDPTVLQLEIGGFTMVFNANVTLALEDYYSHITLNTTDVRASVKMGYNETTKKPTFELLEVAINMTDNSLDFHNEGLNKFVPMLTSILKKEIGSALVVNQANTFIKTALESQDFQVNIYDLLKLDFTMTSAPVVINQAVIVSLNGSSYLAGEDATSCNPFRAHTWSAGKTVDVILNADMFNCLLHTASNAVSQISQLISVARPLGLNLTTTIAQDSNFGFKQGGIAPRINTTVQLGQQNGRGDFIDVELDLNVLTSFNISFSKHDVTGIAVDVTPSEENINFLATNFRGDTRYDPTHQNFAAISQMLSGYLQNILPPGNTTTFTFNAPKEVPGILNFFLSYDLGFIEDGVFFWLQLN